MIIKEADFARIDLTGKTIVFPTDTVYGIGCLFDDKESIDRIFRIKNRDYHKPMAILAADLDMLDPLIEMTDEIRYLAAKHWPGALTLIAKKKNIVSDLVTAGKDTVGVRIPNHPLALALLRRFGPLVTTSLNQSGEDPIMTFKDAMAYEDRVDYLVDGGKTEGIASTVYDAENYVIIRQGKVIIRD